MSIILIFISTAVTAFNNTSQQQQQPPAQQPTADGLEDGGQQPSEGGHQQPAAGGHGDGVSLVTESETD